MCRVSRGTGDWGVREASPYKVLREQGNRELKEGARRGHIEDPDSSHSGLVKRFPLSS